MITLYPQLFGAWSAGSLADMNAIHPWRVPPGWLNTVSGQTRGVAYIQTFSPTRIVKAAPNIRRSFHDLTETGFTWPCAKNDGEERTWASTCARTKTSKGATGAPPQPQAAHMSAGLHLLWQKLRRARIGSPLLSDHLKRYGQPVLRRSLAANAFKEGDLAVGGTTDDACARSTAQLSRRPSVTFDARCSSRTAHRRARRLRDVVSTTDWTLQSRR